jgi:plastocyanin
MRHFLRLLTACLAAGCGSDAGVTPSDTTAAAMVADVFTPGNVFSPFNTSIKVGGSVRFNISGDSHNVIFGKVAGAPADVNVVKDVVASRTFNTRGTYPYDCTVHPGMSGRIVVQ